MSKLTELTREQFNEFKKIKALHSSLYGEYSLFGRKGTKYIAKILDNPFTSTRISSIPFYINENKQKIYFFETETDSLDSILQQRLISSRLNSKHNNSELICWLTKYKSFQINLWEIFKLGAKTIADSPIQILLCCFRIVKGRLVYHYDSWINSTDAIVQGNIHELQKFYFSEKYLKNIRDDQVVPINQKEAIFRLAFLVLHLGTRDMNLRFYQYGVYHLSQDNLNKRVEMFIKRYPKLGQKIQSILLETVDPQQYQTLEQLSSINIDSTLMRNLCNSSVQSHARRSLEQSTSKNKVKNFQTLKKKKLKLKTEQCRILQLECSVLNVLQKIKKLSWTVLIDTGHVPLLEQLELLQYYPVTIYQQKIIRLFARIYLKIVYSKKEYSNGSVYIGQLEGDSRQGKGLYMFQSGDVYYGQWKNNNMDGFGTYIFKNGDSYDGQLRQGLKQGHGKNEYASGNTYDGSWIRNQKKGLGVVNYKNGNMFIGQFFGSLKSAEGIYVDKHGKIIQGFVDKQNQCPPISSSKKVQLCETQNGCSTKCKIFEEGEYSGQLLEGLRNGFGVLKCVDSVYEGYWKNDLRNGQGRLFINNQQIQGVWEEGFIIEYK